MQYEFDKTLDHRKNGSRRWEQPEGRNDIIGMGTADLDYFCPPCVKEACRRILEENTFNYRKKPDSYYKGAIDWYGREYGLTIEKEWLSNVPSTIGAIKIALGTAAKPGDGILMQTPGFGPLNWAVEGLKCHMVENPMVLRNGKYELDLKDFERKVKDESPAAFLLVNPHNPTGRVFTQEELEKMVSICASHGVKIVSDEVHSLIVYDGHKHVPILKVSEEAQKISIQVISMSKGLNIMSLPHAIVTVADADLRKAWNEAIIPYAFDYASNPYTIEAVTSVLSGAADAWLKELTEYLDKNIRFTIDYINEKIPRLVPIRPEAGFLLWVECRNLAVGGKLSQFFLDKARVSLNDGTEFGSRGEGFIRMNLALTRENLKLALERMREAAI